VSRFAEAKDCGEPREGVAFLGDATNRAFPSLPLLYNLVLRVLFAYTRRNDSARFHQHALCRKEILSALFSKAAHKRLAS